MQPQEIVSHYQIKRRLGAGGMGEVYLADDLELKRPVAIKLLTSEELSDDEARQELLREARAAAALDHPNICPVHEVGTDGDQSFIVMQYVEGDTLAERLRRERPSPPESLEIVMQVADALAAAHRQGVVHRDIKPQNIVLTTDGRVKVLDFGLAKRVSRAPSPDDATVITDQVSTLSGTPPYMSPEQFTGEPVDGRSDLFSLGAIYYECLTGERAFPGRTTHEVSGQVQFVNPPLPSSINDMLGPVEDELCSQLLAKDPAKRTQTGEEALRLLELAVRSGTHEQRLGSQKRHRPLSVASYRTASVPLPPKSRPWVAAVLGVVGLAAALFWWQPWSTSAPSTDQSVLRQAVRGVPQQRYLAVLPLPIASLEDRGLAGGLTDALRAMLSRLAETHGVQVVPASLVRELDEATVSAVGTEFGVDSVILVGASRRGGDLQASMSLVSAPGGQPIDTATVTMPEGDLFPLQNRVMEETARLLGLSLSPDDLKRLTDYGTEIPEAYHLYLRGRGFLETFDRAPDTDRAVALFERALELDPEYALARAGLGHAYWERYQATDQPQWATGAAAICEEAVALDAQLVEGHVCRGSAYSGLGRNEEALLAFTRAMTLEPESPDVLHGLAAVYERMGRPADAEDAHRQVIEARPLDWAGYYWLGAFYITESRFDEAAEMFQEVIELTPNSYIGHTNLGVAYVFQEQWDQAVASMERSVDIRPTSSGYSNLATTHFYQGSYFRAASVYEDAIALDERNYLLWGNRGDALHWGPGRDDEAAESYREALRLAEELRLASPPDGLLLGDMALYNAMLGQGDVALGLVEEALVLAPESTELQLQAAQTYQQLGRTDDALARLRAAVEAGVTLDLIERNPWFESIRELPEFQAIVASP